MGCAGLRERKALRMKERMRKMVVNVLLGLALAAVIIWALIRTLRRSKKGGGCCGEHETVAQTNVADRNKAHYPHLVSLKLGGMTCENCARKVANALNGLEGVWAKVKLEDKSAEVRCKMSPDEALIRRTVTEAGYVVMEYQVRK